MNKSPRRLEGGWFVCPVVVGLTLALASPAAADGRRQSSTGAPQESGYVGDMATCLTCHEAQANFKDTPHGWAANPRTPAAAQGCEACHGPAKAHVDGSGDKEKIRSFAAMTPREASETCVTCHNRGVHAEWQGSAHDARNLSCITCHSVHSAKSDEAQLKTATQVETCAQCHRDKVAKLDRSGHMPLREGKMQCSSCHNAHGSANVRLLRAGNSVAESCASCHADKRGPFLWEHAPVRESCASCHDPHGSSNDRMLVAKAPMLCQRCHIHTRHPSTIYDNLVVKTSNRLYARSCVTCHSNIHGSNHASGVTFLR